MFELLTVILFAWLMLKSVSLMLKLTWGIAKAAAGLLTVLALPLLAVCLVFAGGVVLIIPFVMVGAAMGLVKLCS